MVLVIKPPPGAYKRSQILPEAEIAPPPEGKFFQAPLFSTGLFPVLESARSRPPARPTVKHDNAGTAGSTHA